MIRVYAVGMCPGLKPPGSQPKPAEAGWDRGTEQTPIRRFRRSARARGSSHRADTAKPTEGAGDAVPAGRPNRVRRDVAITAPSVGLPKYQPGGLSPRHMPRGEAQRRAVSHAPSQPASAGFSLSARWLEPRAQATAWDPSRHLPRARTARRTKPAAQPAPTQSQERTHLFLALTLTLSHRWWQSSGHRWRADPAEPPGDGAGRRIDHPARSACHTA